MTMVLQGSENVMNIIIQFLSKSNMIYSCGDNKAPKFAIEVEDFRKLLFDLKKGDRKVRYITDITKDNVKYCKQLMHFFDEIRHIDGLRANFSVSEKEYLASVSLLQEDVQPQQFTELLQQIIYSNVRDIVEQQKYVFESFWNKAIPAEQRIREIEEGIEPEFFEVIAEHKRTSQIFLDLTKSVKNEALFLFPNDKAMVRAYRLGVIDHLIKASQKQNSANIKIICPLSKENSDIVRKVSEQAPNIR